MSKKTERVPIRMCRVCREHKPKTEFIRLIDKDGNWRADETQKEQCRSAYVCKSEICIKKLKKHKAFQNFDSEISKTCSIVD